VGIAASALTGIVKPRNQNPVSDLLNSSRLASKNGTLGLGSSGGTVSAGTTPYDQGYGAGFSAPGGKTSISVGGGYVDPATQIWNDPAFQQLKNSLSAQGIADAAHLRGALQSALVQFGSVPNLDPSILQATELDTSGTQALADNNPFSTLKQLAQKYQTSTDAEKNQLAARGILSSGETGYQLGNLGQQQATDQYNATNSLLGGIGSLYDQYVSGQNAAANQLSQGAFTAEGNAAANNAGGGATVSAVWDPASGTYKDASGNAYDQSGNPIAPPAGGGSTAGGAGVAPPNTGGGTAPIAQYDPTKILTPGVTNSAV
jgi:hypothetical protein